MMIATPHKGRINTKNLYERRRGYEKCEQKKNFAYFRFYGAA